MSAGVAVAATVGTAVAAGLTPVPMGVRTLALEAGPGTQLAAARHSAQTHVAQRVLPATTSRDLAGPTPARTTKRTAKPQNPWTCPVAGCVGAMVSGFGARVSPGGIGSTYHRGNDFAIASGTALLAMHSGRVVSTGWVPGFGIHVTIDHGGGVQIIFGHLSSVQVAPGQFVARGQVVGRSGSSGISTGPHLHLEIHVNGVAIDPAPWLRARGIH